MSIHGRTLSVRPGGADPEVVKRVAVSGIGAFAIFLLGAGLAYCSQLFVARIVGVETYGIYAYVLSWMTVLAYICALGFDVALLRYVSAYRAQASWSLLRGVIIFAERASMWVGIVIIAATVGAYAIYPMAATREIKATFLIGSMLVPVLALLWIRCAILRGFGVFVVSVSADRVLREGILIVLVGVVYLATRAEIHAPTIMLFTLIGSLVGLAAATIALGRSSPAEIRAVAPDYDAVAWRATAISLVIIGALDVTMNRTGTLLFGWNGDMRNAGIFSLIFNMAFLVALPRTAINTLFAPTLASLFARKDHVMLQLLMTRSTVWTLCVAVCIAAVLWIFAGTLLNWFGKDFDAGVPAFRVLLVGQVIAASAGSQLYVMTMTGHERSAAKMLAFSAAWNVLVTLVLSRRFGLVGAATATIGSLVLLNVLMTLFIWRRLRLLPPLLALFVTPSPDTRSWPRGASPPDAAHRGRGAELD